MLAVMGLLVASCSKKNVDGQPNGQEKANTAAKAKTETGNKKEAKTASKTDKVPNLSCEELAKRHMKCFFPKKNYDIPVGDSPVLGPKDALVTWVEFSDFQCPYCARMATQIEPELLKKYNGKIRVVFKHFPLPFHQHAMEAAEAAEEVRAQKGNDAFWKFHDEVFKNQGRLGSEGRKFLEEVAKKLGLDMAKFKKAMDEHTHKARIQKDMELAKKIEVQGTPFIYINGQLVERDPAPVVEKQLKRAEELVKKGTPKDKVYETLTKQGKGSGPVRTMDYTPDELKDYTGKFMSICNNPKAKDMMDSIRQCSTPTISCDELEKCAQKKQQEAQKKAREEMLSLTEEQKKLTCDELANRHLTCMMGKKKVYDIPVGDSPVLGPKDAPVTWIEFSDFQCPYCGRMATQTEPELLKKYAGKVRVVFKHFPLDFHQHAMEAAEAASEVYAQKGNSAFWKFHDEVFKNQERLSKEGMKFLREVAKKLGLDMAKFDKAMNEHTHKARIQKDKDLANEIGVRGTPYIYINGQFVRGDPSQVLEEQLKRAEKAIAGGVAKNKVYEHMTKVAKDGKKVHEVPYTDKELKDLRAKFMSSCTNPQAKQVTDILRKCSKKDISCDEFRNCVEQKMRMLMGR